MSKISTIIKIIKAYKDWPRYFGVYLGVTRKERFIFRTRNGLRFWLRRSNDDLARIGEIFHLHEYDPKFLKIPKGGTVIDIGAHMGFFSIYASHKGAARVISFEPMPDNFEMLSKHIALNSKTNIGPHQLAVAAKPGNRTFYVSKNSGFGSLFRKTDQELHVKCTTLSQVFKDHKILHCDLLKMDCEGAEYEILYASQALLPKIKTIILEYHDGTRFDAPNDRIMDLQKFLDKNGFTTKRVAHPNQVGMLYAWR
ncbi:MAG TPA: FkbM family methyltransferase [Candidatus Nanoarchaeia archaeon]|nr:FkbM family methyltransferase [Candidatus Nanoarchaeia archaeon]